MTAQKGRPLTSAQRQVRQRNSKNNSKKSIGPRTLMGKKIVSLNAVKHGMYSCPSLQTMAVLEKAPCST